MTEHQLKAWQTGGGAVMHATVIPFARTQTSSVSMKTARCEECDGTDIYEDEIHMHTLVQIVRRECGACDGSGFIEIEAEDA